MDDLLQEMIRPAGPTAQDRARRLRLIASAATVGLAVVGVTSLTTSALFRDNDAAGANGFTTGTVSIDATPDSVVITTDPLVAPGDTTWFEFNVTNDGSLAQRYAIEYTATNGNSPEAPADRAVPDLAGQVDLSIYAKPAGVTCDDASAGATTPLVPTAKVSNTPSQPLLGTTAAGLQGGERSLDSNAAEQLCISLHLPTDLENTFVSSTLAVNFVFFAEQTKNN